MNKSLGLALGLVTPLLTSIGQAQSFDCKKAATAIEQAICTNKSLGELDTSLATEFKTLLDATPDLRMPLAAGQRHWIADRNQKCGAPASATANATSACLTNLYQARITELKTGAAKQAAALYSTASCQKIADRYRGLANTHAGESPLAVLTERPHSDITLVNGTDLPDGMTGLTNWSQAQTPPFSITGDLPELEDQVTIARLPGRNFYWLSNIEGTANCYSSVYFTVRKGIAQAASAPPGFESQEDMSQCGVRLSFGTLDAAPVFIEEDYDWTPNMSASIKVATWDDDRFAAACSVAFGYAPKFSHQTLNTAQESCTGAACERLRGAAFELVAAVQGSPLAARAEYEQKLSGPEREEYAKLEKAMQKPDDRSRNNPGEITDELPVHLPYLMDGHLWVASVGHMTVGWRYYADWIVTFDRSGNDGSSASFPVGMVKGTLTNVTIAPLATGQVAGNPN